MTNFLNLRLGFIVSWVGILWMALLSGCSGVEFYKNDTTSKKSKSTPSSSNQINDQAAKGKLSSQDGSAQKSLPSVEESNSSSDSIVNQVNTSDSTKAIQLGSYNCHQELSKFDQEFYGNDIGNHSGFSSDGVVYYNLMGTDNHLQLTLESQDKSKILEGVCIVMQGTAGSAEVVVNMPVKKVVVLGLGTNNSVKVSVTNQGSVEANLGYLVGINNTLSYQGSGNLNCSSLLATVRGDASKFSCQN